MSLVNDMLRDLEARRADPAERRQLGGLRAVDEVGATRRGRRIGVRLGLLLVIVAALLAAALYVIDRLQPRVEPVAVLAPTSAVPTSPAPVAVVPAAPVVDAPRLLEVLPQNDGRHFVLQLLLDRPVSYQRTEATGSISFDLPGVRFAGEALSGRIEKGGHTLSWRVESHAGGVQIMLVGLGDALQAADRVEPAGDRSQLWLDVPLEAASTGEADDEPSLPVAAVEPDEGDAAQWPEWVTREAPAAEPAHKMAARPSVALAPSEPQRSRTQAIAPQPAPAADKRLEIGSHRPTALADARQALARGDYRSAIQQLQALAQAQPDSSEISRLLARAYLGAGDTTTLLGWLPAQLERHPDDIELRELLARAQLKAGDQAGAIATLRTRAPQLQRNPGYHALLAALYQQVGDWSSSAALYRQLVVLRPDQASWQLGLGIALEQLDQRTQAARHYRIALQGQGLDSNARRFAGERASSLGGTP